MATLCLIIYLRNNFIESQGQASGSFFSLGSVQFSSVTQSCPTLCDPMNCSTPGLPVHHQLLEFTQTHVHWVGDAIQPSHPLLFPSPPAFNLSQHQGPFKWVSSLHQVKPKEISCHSSWPSSRDNCLEVLYSLAGYTGCNLFMNSEKYEAYERSSLGMFLSLGKILLIEMWASLIHFYRLNQEAFLILVQEHKIHTFSELEAHKVILHSKPE